MNKFILVTDPDDPEVEKSLEVLLDLIKDEYIIETNYDKGLVRYEIYTNQNIQALVNKISYDPISIVINSEPKYNEGMKTIVKALTKKLLDISIEHIDTVLLNNNITTFVPIDIDNQSLYSNSNYVNDYYEKMNIQKYLGYQLLSANPLTRLVLNDIVNNDIVNNEVIYVEGIYLIPINNGDNKNIINRVETIVNKYVEDGYFVYSVGHHNKEDLALIPELASLWDTEVIQLDDDQIILKSDLMDLSWFQRNVNTIKNGLFPSITLYGSWQFDVGGDYNQIYDKPLYKYTLYYAALLAYRDLSGDDFVDKDGGFISPFTQSVKVNNDLSITISVPTYKHSILFKEKLKDVLKDQNLFETVYCKNITDGAVKRYYVQSIDPKSVPMVLPGESGDVMIFRSPTTIPYDSPYVFNNIDPALLTLDLREYYNKCHNNMEPITLDEINTMNLEKLLNLVKVQERLNQPTFCYTKDTLLSLNKPVNPMTRRPFKDHVLIKAMMTEWGLRGLFDVGPIKGLYNDIPKKILIEPKSGSTNILLQPTNLGNEINNEPNIYDVVINFDQYEQVIFSITTNDKKELKQLVADLWESGFFLSYWTASLEKYTNPSSYRINVTNSILLHGSDSIEDGINAMNYLRENLN